MRKAARSRQQQSIKTLVLSSFFAALLLSVCAIAEPIPNTPFAIRAELPPSFKAAILNTVNQTELVAATGRWYIDPTADLALTHLAQLYNSLRDVAQLLNLDPKELE